MSKTKGKNSTLDRDFRFNFLFQSTSVHITAFSQNAISLFSPMVLSFGVQLNH